MKEDNPCIKVGNKYLYQVFHENTALTYENSGAFVNSIMNYYESNHKFDNSCEYPVKSYISLKSDLELQTRNLSQIFEARKSSRDFSDKAVSQESFFYILRYAVGGQAKEFPNYPISGGIECFTILVLITNVENINSGIYIYERRTERLNLLSNDFSKLDYFKITLSKDLTQNSAFSIHILAHTEAKCLKYQDRGYRFLLLEAGHLAQNFYLIANSIGIGVVSSGGYLDYGLQEFLPRERNMQDLELLYELFLGNVL